MGLYDNYEFKVLSDTEIVKLHDKILAIFRVNELKDMDWGKRISAIDEFGYRYTFIIDRVVSVTYDSKNNEWVVVTELKEEVY